MKALAIVLLICLGGFVASGETYPSNAGVLNVRDFGAKGDGVTDDTAAINRAIAASTPAVNTGDYWGQAKIVYLPAGTYLISSPLLKTNGAGNPTYGMVLIGQSQSSTTIQLSASAAGFGDASHPLGMIHPTSDASYGWAPAPGDGNAAYQNTIQDLTIDIGTDNPGAIGVDYLASNLGAIRNVTLQAGSGTSGVTGIRMTRQDMGPALLENVTVTGFPVGLDIANLQYSLTLDHVTLNGQTVAGLRTTQNQIAVNALTATTAGPAIVNSSADGEIVVSGAVLHRASGYTGDLIVNRGTIVFRNSNGVDGYASFTGSSLPGDVVNGMLSPAGFTNGASGSYNTSTAIEDPPSAFTEPVSNWVSVAAYGAQPSADFTDTNDNVASPVDASAGIQRTMNSGASTIYLPHGVYYLASPVTIPATVQRIVGLDSTLHPMLYESWRSEGMFRVLANSSTPLVIEQLRFDNSNDGAQLALEHSSNRALIVRDTLFPGTLAINRASSGGPLFMEDVSAAGSNATVAGPAIFEARQFDFENCGTCAYVSATPTVLMGMKEEGDVTEVAATNGAHVDVLGGLGFMVWNPTDSATPLFKADSTSTLSASFNEAQLGSCCTIANYLVQTVGGQSCEVQATSFPTRSDGGHVVGMLRTGPAIYSPSSATVAIGAALSIGGMTVSDASGGNCSGTISLKLDVSAGSISMNDATGNPIMGSGTSSIVHSGTLSQVNAALATLLFSAGNTAETDTLSAAVTDQAGASFMADTFIEIGGGLSGQPAVILSANTLSFGNVIEGPGSAPQTITVTNTGSATLNISGISIIGSGGSGFTETTTCGESVAAGTSCAISVTFTPSSAIAYQATLAVADNATNSPQNVALGGTGTAAPAPDFSLTASTQAFSLSPGKSGTVTLTVTPANGFSGSVLLSCTSRTAGFSCSFSQGTVNPQSGSVQSTLTVVAPVSTAANRLPHLPATFGAFALSLCALIWKRNRRLSLWLVPVLWIPLLILPCGCGGASTAPSIPPKLSSVVVVNATSGSLQHALEITVDVQ